MVEWKVLKNELINIKKASWVELRISQIEGTNNRYLVISKLFKRKDGTAVYTKSLALPIELLDNVIEALNKLKG